MWTRGIAKALAGDQSLSASEGTGVRKFLRVGGRSFS
jgi:hypothetical protein